MENQITNNEVVEITPTNTNSLDFQELIEKSANLDKLKPLITLTAEYIELEKPSEFFDGVFIGYQNMEVIDQQSGELKKLEACRFIVNKQVRINAGVVLVNECKRANLVIGTPVKVTYQKKEGNTKIYLLTLLG